MLKGLTKAIKLEFNSMKESKLSFLFYLIVPVIIIWLFANLGSSVVYSGDITVYDFLGVKFFALIILFTTMQMTILRIVGERAPYGTLDRDLLAISRSGMFLGKLTANAIFVFIQCVLIYIIGFVVFPTGSNYSNPITIILMLFLIGIFGLLFGLVISVISKTKEQAVQFIPFIILLFLITSDFFFLYPPESIKILSLINPLSISYKLVEGCMSDAYALQDMMAGSFSQNFFLKIIIWIVALLTIGIFKFQLERKK